MTGKSFNGEHRFIRIPLSFPANGTYQLSLTASSVTFDGAILGTATVTITASSTAFQSVTFDFGTIAVTESTPIAFTGAVPSKPPGVAGKVMMQFVTDPRCRLTETNGTDAPLSTFRRGGIAAVINGDVAATFNHIVTVAAVASIHGANGTFFHTDVWINNPLGVPVSITATYHCFGGVNCGTGTAQINIDAGKAVTFTDIVQTLFGAPETAGAICVCLPVPLLRQHPEGRVADVHALAAESDRGDFSRGTRRHRRGGRRRPSSASATTEPIEAPDSGRTSGSTTPPRSPIPSRSPLPRATGLRLARR